MRIRAVTVLIVSLAGCGTQTFDLLQYGTAPPQNGSQVTVMSCVTAGMSAPARVPTQPVAVHVWPLGQAGWQLNEPSVVSVCVPQPASETIRTVTARIRIDAS